MPRRQSEMELELTVRDRAQLLVLVLQDYRPLFKGQLPGLF